MENIGEGYFYNVFDIENNRVLKKRKDFGKIAESLKGNTNINPISKWLKTYKYASNCAWATGRIKERIKKSPALQRLLGNPIFINLVDYEQDKVILLMDYFASHSLEENKAIIDKYMSLIEQLLRYEIHDYVYKFKNSYGITKGGEAVLVDFNEVIFSKEKTLEFVLSKQWEKEAQFRKYEEGELKEYLREKFTEVLTVENVNRIWGKKVFD